MSYRRCGFCARDDGRELGCLNTINHLELEDTLVIRVSTVGYSHTLMGFSQAQFTVQYSARGATITILVRVCFDDSSLKL